MQMKLVVSYVKPHVLPNIVLALQLVKGFTGISVLPARGLGWKVRESEELVVSEGLEMFDHAVRIEVVCQQRYLDDIVRTIRENARTGIRGDGLTYVIDLSAVRRNADEEAAT